MYAHLYRKVTASDVVQTVCETAAASEERTGMVVRIILGAIVRHPGWFEAAFRTLETSQFSNQNEVLKYLSLATK